MFSRKYNGKGRLDGKTVVITGANTGLGKETAKDLFIRGARVILACRNLEKAKEATDDIRKDTKDAMKIGELVIEKLNLASLASVRECAAHLLRTEPHIHLLINNAGVAFQPKMLTEDGFEQHFGVNHLGHFLLTLLLLPRIIKSAPSRIINVSSIYHVLNPNIPYDDLAWEHRNYNASVAYSQSKLANILFTKELASRLRGTGVTTYAVHPGVVRTEVFRNVDRSVMRGARWLVRNIGRLTMISPKRGAQTTIYCAVDDRVLSQSGKYFSNCSRSIPFPTARDPERAKKLWQASIRLVDLNDWDPFTAEDRVEPELWNTVSEVTQF